MTPEERAKFQVSKAVITHGETYDYSLVVRLNRSHDAAPIICRRHGMFMQDMALHVYGAGCLKCSGVGLKTKEEVLSEIAAAHGDKYGYEDFVYTGNLQKIAITCKLHDVFQQTIKEHKKGSGCPKCRRNYKKTTATFLTAAKETHGDTYDYTKTVYTTTDEPIVVTCRTHGDFTTTPHKHLSGYGCLNCVSNVSSKEREWLDSLNIPHLERQKILILGGKKRSVDGFDPDTNTAYEFQGYYFHGHPKYFKSHWTNRLTKETFGECHRKTQEKNKLIKEAGYKLVEMWETDFVSQTKSNKFKPLITDTLPDPSCFIPFINARRMELDEDFNMSDYIHLLQDKTKVI